MCPSTIVGPRSACCRHSLLLYCLVCITKYLLLWVSAAWQKDATLHKILPGTTFSESRIVADIVIVSEEWIVDAYCWNAGSHYDSELTERTLSPSTLPWWAAFRALQPLSDSTEPLKLPYSSQLHNVTEAGCVICICRHVHVPSHIRNMIQVKWTPLLWYGRQNVIHPA
jgi:hypothetical protein